VGHVIATTPSKIRSELFENTRNRLWLGRDVCGVYSPLDKQKKESKKRNQEKKSIRVRTQRSSTDGIGRTTGSCNSCLCSHKDATQRLPIPLTAKRRSADIPTRTGSVSSPRDSRAFLLLCLSLSTPPKPQLSAANVISPFRWRDRG
jgi:hypothetical protein